MRVLHLLEQELGHALKVQVELAVVVVAAELLALN
jgi:hypothetical protein